MSKPDSKQVKLSRDGIPVDAKDWTAADWQDLHRAIERAKALIRKRHSTKTREGDSN